MKITRRQLKRIINEEINRALNESEDAPKADADDSVWKAFFKKDCEKQAAGFKNAAIRNLTVDACVDSRMATRKSKKKG